MKTVGSAGHNTALGAVGEGQDVAGQFQAGGSGRVLASGTVSLVGERTGDEKDEMQSSIPMRRPWLVWSEGSRDRETDSTSKMVVYVPTYSGC